MKRLITICAIVTTVLAIGSTALAGLSWQTTPVLGTDVSDEISPGNLVVITATGNVVIPYADEIPSTGASMTQFTINPITVGTGANEGHMVDLVAGIYSGSGVYLDPEHTYSYTGVYSYLSPNAPYSITAAEATDFSEGSGFVMLSTGISQLWLEDIGNWTYTETWTNNADSLDTITSGPIAFTVVPEPATFCLLGLGALSLIKRKKQKGCV